MVCPPAPTNATPNNSLPVPATDLYEVRSLALTTSQRLSGLGKSRAIVLVPQTVRIVLLTRVVALAAGGSGPSMRVVTAT